MDKRDLGKGRATPQVRALSVVLSIQLAFSMLPAEAIAEVRAHASMPSQSPTGIEFVEEPSSDEATGIPADDPATGTSELSFTSELSSSELVGSLDPVSSDEPISERKVVTDVMGAIVSDSEEATYVFENSDIRVVARLSDRSAVPEDAKLLVTAIQKDTEGYDFDAYLRALNAASEKEHAEGNVLLYDLAFKVGDTKITPGDGSVSIGFDFKKGQLDDEIGAQYPEDIEVIGLTAKDDTVSVEPIKAEVSVSDEQARFETTGLSVYAFSRPTAPENDEHIHTTLEEDDVRPSILTTGSNIDDPVSDEKVVNAGRPSLVATLKSLDYGNWIRKALNNFRESFGFISGESGIYTFGPAAIASKNDQKTMSLAEALKGLAISEQPASATVAAGQTAAFTVAVSGSGLIYRWQQKDPGTSSWTRSALGGNRTRTLSFTAEEGQSGTKFRCVVTDKSGQKVISSAATLKVTAESHTTYRALLVGNANYRGTSNDLPECATDAKAMATMLRGLSSEYTTTVSLNRSASQIASDISSTFSEADDDDVSLFYYSGHGAYSARPEYLGALCGVNDTYLTTSKLAQTLSGVRGKVIVILDSCYSGAAIAAQDDQSGFYAPDIDMSAINQHIIDSFAAYDSGLYLNTQSDSTSKSGELRQSKFVVLTACSESETSSIGIAHGTRGSLSTIALLEGAGCSYPSGAYKGSMPADTNDNKQISLQEAKTYELKHVTSYSCQTYGSKDEVLFDRK